MNDALHRWLPVLPRAVSPQAVSPRAVFPRPVRAPAAAAGPLPRAERFAALFVLLTLFVAIFA